MRFLVLTNNYPPFTLGGYEVLCEDHVGWLKEAGHEVTVVTSRYGLDARDGDRAGGRFGEDVHRVLDFHWSEFEHRRPTGLGLLSGERRQCRLVRTLAETTRPDAVLVWGMAAVSKSLLAAIHDRGTPMVAVVEETWPIWDIDSDAWLRLGRPSRMPRWAREAWSATAGRVLSLIAPIDIRPAMRSIRPVYASRYLQEVVEAKRPEWRGRGTVSLNGIRFEAFDRPRDRAAPLGSPLSLLYAGRVESRKGVHTAVEALAGAVARGIAARLTIVGWRDSAYAEELVALAKKLEVSELIDWRDPVDRGRLADVYRAHDVLVFPTIWAEPFGLVPLEAMAASCLVVGTGTGGSGEYLKDRETALVFPPEDATALVDRLAELVADPGLVATLRKGGLATARAHTFDRFARDIFEVAR